MVRPSRDARDAWRSQVGFLFDPDDGSLPEIRLTGLTAEQTPRVYARLRALAARLNDGASLVDRRAEHEVPVDAVPNAASLVVAGHVDGFHVVLRAPRVGAVVLPDLGVFVAADEIALDYRMGAQWGATEIAALLALLCELHRIAPGSRVELEEHAEAGARERFAAAVARRCAEGGAPPPGTL
ncbi:hypothetical protein [Roseisolibacter sp. H3M3-2]|uniref:hypothetical protein n=1 Tax=Roseisolibacter sp. H3M3-2 TaxID=3031323 RepID=UPI0023DA5924|nr:hypothetical protein [Roseisolibacter sp. H3M3-2]MDF1503631.1 hypothetical protein [Roseisolibacter sp. H3M3-2]